MRNHGALRLVAVAAFAVTLVAAPAVAQQASDDQRTRTENRPSAPAVRTSVPNRSPAVRQPARTPERSPAIRTPASTQPTIRREIPRTQPADGGTRAPSKRPAIEHGTTRRPHYLDREPSIHQRFPRTPTTGGAHPAPDAQRITFDRDAITLRLDDYSPAERARILEGLMQLVRGNGDASGADDGGDQEGTGSKPSDGPEAPHVPHGQRGRLVPPPDDEVETTPPETTPPPVNTGVRPVYWDWGWGWRLWDWWDRWDRLQWSMACAFDPSWMDLSLGDRILLSRFFGASVVRFWSWGLGPTLWWSRLNASGCLDRDALGRKMTWDQYANRLEREMAASEGESKGERVDCARVTVQRFDGAAASFAVALPVLGAETLDELRDAIAERLSRGESVALPVVLKPGEVDKFSVKACQAGR